MEKKKNIFEEEKVSWLEAHDYILKFIARSFLAFGLIIYVGWFIQMFTQSESLGEMMIKFIFMCSGAMGILWVNFNFFDDREKWEEEEK